MINSDYYAYLAGYKQFENPHKIDIDILATPGIDYVNNLDLVNDVLDIIEESRQGDCLYIVTTPDKESGSSDNADMYTAEEAVDNFMSTEINTSYAATYFPWVKFYDAANKKYINLPVTKDVVRNFAHTDNVAHPWFASAGMSRGNVECVKARHFTKLEEEDVLYEGMINPVKSFGSEGVKLWGNKTMYLEDTPLNRINVRRLMIRIKKLVSKAAKQLIFEQNDNTVEAQFRSIVEPILANAKQNRGLSDYKIKTDTSAEARDRHELPAAIYVKPINCLEYIPITFTIYPEGAKFDE
jgi:phage tail sheath protein FI